MNEELLQQYVVTANSGKYKSWEEINSKFPELSSYDPAVLQQYVVTANSGKYNSWKDINDKFPEFFKTTGKETQPNRYAPQMGPTPFKPQAPEEESYLPKSYDEEVKSLNDAYNQIYSQNDLYTAKTADFKNKERLLNNVQKNLADRAKIRVNDYVQKRIKELKPRTEQERVQMNDQLKREVDNLANKEIQYINDFSKPYQDLYNSAASDPVVVAMQGSESFAEGFKKTFESMQQTSQIIESYMPIQSVGMPFARRMYATLTGELPGYQRAATAAGVSNDYDEQLANQYKLKNRINADIARQRGAVIPANWEDQIKQTAVQERIAEVGEAKYLQEKQEFAQQASAKKQELMKQSEYYLGKAEGVKSGLIQQWADVKSAGDLYDYVTGGVGQTVGLMVPTVAASLIPGVGTTAGIAVSMGVMSQFEKGIAYKDAIDEIKKSQEEQGNPMTEAEIFASPLDKLAGDAATEAGLINAALESIGTLAIVGRLLPKGIVSDLLGKSLASKAGKAGSVVDRLRKTTGGKIADVSFRAFIEGLTEASQAFVTKYQSYKAAGYSDEQAYELASKQDYTEDFVGGLTAGGGIAAATSALTPAEKKANQIETIINNVSDTGSPDINQQIDNEVTITAPTGDLGTEQQGAAPVQEGAQPEGRGTETETGGVLQVSPETPGAQAEVTPEANIEAKKADIERRRKEQLNFTTTAGYANIAADYLFTGGKNSILSTDYLLQALIGSFLGAGKKIDAIRNTYASKIGNIKDDVGTDVYKSMMEEIRQAIISSYSDPNAIKIFDKILANPTGFTFSEGRAVSVEVDQLLEAYQKNVNALADAEIAALTPQVTPEVTPQVTPEVTPTEDLEAQALQELQQLEQPTTQQPEQPTTEVTPEAEIEAIKRRWQEALNSVKNWRDKIQAAKTKESLQEIVKLIAGKDPYNVKETDFTIVSALQVPDTFEKGKELLIKDLESIEKFFTAQEYKKINTEYESQLAALTPQVTPKEQVTPQVEVTPEVTTQPTTEQPVTEQPTPPQPTAEQPTVEQPTTEQAVTEQPVTPQPEVPTAEQPANLNDFKRYFFNKDPKAFGGNLGTALGMSEMGWQKAYNKFAKKATPEELKMLDALRGKQVTNVTTPEVTAQQVEQEVILIDKTALLNAGYTNQQVKLVENNPDKFAQIDDKIVNIATNEVIKPKGRKKTQETPDVKPKETFPKTTYADLEKAMFTPGVKLDELLRIVIGMNNDYSALAEQLLNIYKGNKTVRLTKFDTKREARGENTAWGVYRPDNTVAVFVNDIKKYWESKVSPEQAKEEIENNTTRVLLHEIVHAYTVKQLEQAIPAIRNLKPEIRALKAYLKHGDNQGIKDIITLYLSARDQIKDLQKEQDKDSDYFSYKDRALARILEQAKGTEAYGLTNIHEFLTEAFTTTEFQRLLNRLKSPIAPKTIWQSFVDAVKKILNIATTGSKELSPVKAGSVLESVLRIAPTIMVTDKYFSGVSEGVSMMSPAPQDARTAALTKLAQGLINKGATRENVIERVKQSIAGKFDIDVDAYAEDILAGISVREKEVTGKFNADTEVANIVNTPYNQILTSKKPDNVKPADFKQQQVEALADFLRGKVTSKEQVQDFVLTWNDANPNNQISKNITNEAWDRLKTARPEAAATAVVKINDMIRIQALEWAKGKAQGVRETTKQFREKIIKMVQDSVKGSNLTSNQVNSILAAVKRVNLFTPGSISKLADRIAQIEAKAEYAEKLNNAKSLRKQLSNLAKPKEAKVSNYTALARQFRRIDIDYLTSYSGEGFTGIDPLDAYIAAATAIKNGFANPKLDNYERIIVSQIQDYINHQIDFKNVEQARELAETATEEQIKAIAVDGMSVKELESLVNELQMQERAQELQEQLREMDNPDGILNKLNSVDLNTLNADELATYIHVADNIIANEDYSLVDKFSNKLLSKERIAELNKTLGSVNKGKLIQGYKGLQQITQMLDAIFNFSKYAATMYNLSGIYDYIAGTARVENRKIAMAKGFEKEIDRIDSKNMGKPQLRLKTEQAKLLMLSELGKYTLDSTEHIEKVHDNIQKSIDKWKKKDKKYGDEIQKIYDQYKNVMSAEEAIEAFKKNDPHVYELWKYTTNQIFTKELTDEVALNTKSVHNKVFIPFVNYSPTALTTIDIEAAPAEQERKSAKPVQAGTTKEARRTMSSGQAYDFDNYINDILYAFTETIHDVETSKHLQLFNNVANNPDFENLIGGSDNRNYIIQRVVSTDKIERKLGDKVNETVSILNNIADGISQFGVTTALGGLDQMALQYPSAAVTTMIMLGSDARLFFAAPTKLNPKMQEAVNKILEKQDIAVRGQAHKYELNNKNFDFKSKSKIIKGLSKVRSGLSYLQKDLLLKPLILSDMSVAQRSYIAFYMKSLRDQGIKNVDLMTEPDMINEPSRKQALAYASMMLSNLQVASTTAGRSAFIQEPGNLGVLRKVLLPFSSFPINTKIRMIRALNKLYSSPKRTEGLQELIAVMTEAATFASIKIYLLPFYYAAVKAGMEAIAGFEAPEDEEEEDRNKNWRKLKTQMALEAIPFNVGSVGAWGSQWMINSMNYAMTETEARTTQEFLKDMGEDPMFERLQSWNKYNEFYGYGQYGIGMDRYADIINAGVNYFRDDFVTLDNGYGEQIINKDSHELERLAMMNLLIQALPATPRELRTQMGKIEREQFKMAKERQSEE